MNPVDEAMELAEALRSDKHSDTFKRMFRDVVVLADEVVRLRGANLAALRLAEKAEAALASMDWNIRRNEELEAEVSDLKARLAQHEGPLP